MKEAAVDDGLLDILIIKKCPLVELGKILVALGRGATRKAKASFILSRAV